jgi:hypothetical protein
MWDTETRGYGVTLSTPSAPMVASMNECVRKGYAPASGIVSSTTAPPPGGMVIVWLPTVWLAGLPSAYTSLNRAPMNLLTMAVVGRYGRGGVLGGARRA